MVVHTGRWCILLATHRHVSERCGFSRVLHKTASLPQDSGTPMHMQSVLAVIPFTKLILDDRSLTRGMLSGNVFNLEVLSNKRADEDHSFRFGTMRHHGLFNIIAKAPIHSNTCCFHLVYGELLLYSYEISLADTEGRGKGRETPNPGCQNNNQVEFQGYFYGVGRGTTAQR